MGNAIKYIKKEISHISSHCKEEEVIFHIILNSESRSKFGTNIL